jgi:alpha-glucoside transport system substrate-binding protein
LHAPHLARLPIVAPTLVVFIAAGCASGTARGSATQVGTIDVMAVWSGTEQQHFERVVAGFEASTHFTVTYLPAPGGVPAALAAKLAAGDPPDVAFLPQPGVLREYAVRGRLVPLDAIAGAEVAANYTAVWRNLASVGGHLYGVWFKAADKSLIWYNLGAFEQAGVVPPDTVERLIAVAHTLTGAGIAAFAVGGGNRWTLTDWFENLYLRVAGPQRYDLLADHQLAWTDQSVKDALHLMAQVLAPDVLAGGTEGALTTTFAESVADVVASPPAAAMTAEGDFVAGAVPAGSHIVLGVDLDAFPFPAVGPSGPAIEGGGDVAVLLRRSAAGAAFLRYLATPDAAARWATVGGFVSPNVNLDLSVYPDDLTRSIARSILDAGDSFRFDLSDLQPPEFGSTPSAGMQAALAAFLISGDVDATANRLEMAARAAYGT